MVNFTLDNEVNTLIRNVGNHSVNNASSLHKKPESSISTLREPQNRNKKEWPFVPSGMWFTVV